MGAVKRRTENLEETILKKFRKKAKNFIYFLGLFVLFLLYITKNIYNLFLIYKYF